MSKALVPTAKDINEAHKLARQSAETAVEHAIRCGKMLAQKKASLPHGKFEEWVKDNCAFGLTSAKKYMIAAGQNATGVAFSSLKSLFYKETEKTDPPSEKPNTSARSVKGAVMNPPESAARGSEARNRNTPVGVDAGQVRPPVPAPEPDAPEMPSADEMAEIDAAVDREYSASIAKVMEADDKLAAANAEIKRQAAEIAVLKSSRDGFMNGKEAITQLLKAEQRKTARLEKRIQNLETENEQLKERVAIMEAA